MATTLGDRAWLSAEQLSMAEFDAVRDPPTDLSVPGFWILFSRRSRLVHGTFSFFHLLARPFREPAADMTAAMVQDRCGTTLILGDFLGFVMLTETVFLRLTSSSSNACKLQNFKIRQASVGCSCIRRISGLPLRASVRRAFGSCPA